MSRAARPFNRCKSATFQIDGATYTIVASPPEKKKDSSDDPSVPPPPTSKNGQLSKQGSLTILRRSSSRTLSGRGARHSSDGDPADNVDLLQDALPAVDTPESCEKAALRLRALLRHLQEGEVAVGVLQKNLQFAADVLDTLYVEETKSEATKDRAITISLGPPTKKGRRPPLSAVALASRLKKAHI